MSGLITQFFSRRGAIALRNPCGDSTYEELASDINETIRTLRQGGVGAGNRILFQPSHDKVSVVTLLALLELESCVVLGNSRWPQSMIDAIKKRSRASVSVAVDTTGRVNVSRESDIPALSGECIGSASVVVPTSGSSGEPKLALIPVDRLLSSAQGALDVCALSAEDCWQLSLPLFHVGGLGVVLRSIVAGSSIDLSSLQQSVVAANASLVTHLSLVPTQLHRLIRDPQGVEFLRRQKAILLGGAPIGATLCREACSLELAIMPTYGLTEMSSLVTIEKAPFVNARGEVSLGCPVPGREFSVSGEGEVLVRGNTLFAGYLSDEGIEPSIDEQGWFHTRDQGSVGPCGELFVVGRADYQFISGGENIHPEMIEIALTSIAPIVAACVVPTPDEEFGSRPVAFVVCDGGELNQSNIKERLRSLVPSYAIPVEIHVAPHEIVSSSGKIQRRVALGLLQKS